MTGDTGSGRIITFYSYNGGTGRTMALANVAWILASNGHRVLAVDWDLESPTLHRYYHPFLVDGQLRNTDGIVDMMRAYAETAAQSLEVDLAGFAHRQVGVYPVSLRYDFATGGGIDLVPAGRQVGSYSTAVSTFNWDDFYERLAGGKYLRELRQQLRQAYDFVLIDSRSGLSDTAGICTVLLPDAVVNCFTLNSASIDGAAAVARSIRGQQDSPIEIFPVPMRVDRGASARLARGLAYASERLRPFLGPSDPDSPSDYWKAVEIPYRVDYAHEETLATFADQPGQRTSLLAAFERLTSVLIGRTVALRPPTQQMRLDVLARFERRAPSPATSIGISYAAPDRLWAEWIASQLRAIGQHTTLADLRTSPPGKTGSTLILMSREYVRAFGGDSAWDSWLARAVSSAGRVVVCAWVDAPETFPGQDGVAVLDLSGMAAATARQALFAVLDLVDTEYLPPEDVSVPRFPADPPSGWRVPARNPAFTGRAAELDALREAFVRRAGTVAVVGPSGMGKTQIALEYAYRFASAYDIVWWVSADQPALLRSDLAQLGAALGLDMSQAVSKRTGEVLEALGAGRPSKRWLVVFDNAEAPGDVGEYLPSGPGDVLVTSSDPGWSSTESTVEVAALDRQDSVALLRSRAHTVDAETAQRLAERLGDIPLAVDLAAAWLAETDTPPEDYVALLEAHAQTTNVDWLASDHRSAALAWSVTLDWLRGHRPAAVRLLELCAFLAPEPIPIRMLSTSRMIEELAAQDRSLRDPILHGRLVRDLGRYAAVRVDPVLNTIRVHSFVQAVIRGTLSEERRHDVALRVHAVLAGAAPAGGPEDRRNWPAYEDLRVHIGPSGALDSADDAVRHLVLDMIRYLRLRGDITGSEELAVHTLKRWSAAFGEDDPLTMRVRVQLATALRAQGRYGDSGRISEDVYPKTLELLGADHPYCLEAAAGLAGDLHGLGAYQPACELAKVAFTSWREIEGEDQPRALAAAHLLAAAYRLIGDFAAAERLDRATLATRRLLHGEDDQSTLASADAYGRDLRETGDLGGAAEHLEGTLAKCRDVLGEDHPDTLRTEKNFAVTQRRLGRLDVAHDLGRDALTRSERVLGPWHPDTVACALEFACLLSERGEHDPAVKQTNDVLDHIAEGHPVALVAMNNLVIMHSRAGNYKRALIELVLQRLAASLGVGHPYTMACQVNLATILHLLGDDRAAVTLDSQTYTSLFNHFGLNHPAVLAAAHNLALSRKDDGGRSELLAMARALAGDGSTMVRAMTAHERVYCDIEPQPT